MVASPAPSNLTVSRGSESQIRKYSALVLTLIFNFVKIPYSGTYKHDTRRPIDSIKNKQSYKHVGHQKKDLTEEQKQSLLKQQKKDLIGALAHFRQVKSKELDFVARAATLSAAAVLAVFSWPSVENTTVWVAKVAWNWSLTTSIFALISSAHHRLLRHLPDPDKKESDKRESDNTDYMDDQIQLALNLFLRPPASPDTEGQIPKPRDMSWGMLWVWQCPLMLMSYSWVLFLVGYGLHMLTPVLDPSQKEVTRAMAICTFSGAAVPLGNFIFCAGQCFFRLRRWTEG